MTGRGLVKQLRKNGWVVERIKGSHHIMCKGQKTISIPVHGKKELPKGILIKLLKEGGLK